MGDTENIIKILDLIYTGNYELANQLLIGVSNKDKQMFDDYDIVEYFKHLKSTDSNITLEEFVETLSHISFSSIHEIVLKDIPYYYLTEYSNNRDLISLTIRHDIEERQFEIVYYYDYSNNYFEPEKVICINGFSTGRLMKEVITKCYRIDENHILNYDDFVRATKIFRFLMSIKNTMIKLYLYE